VARYRLRQSIEPFPAPDGALYLLRVGADDDLVVRDPDAADLGLVDLLARQAVSEAEAYRALRSAGVAIGVEGVREKLAALTAAGLVVEAPATAADERFARQAPYLLELDGSGAGQARLRDASVLIVGCGGLGTWSLAALASLGVGRFVLVDHDAIEVTNLNRQILFGAGDVGRGKVDVAVEWARRFDPAIEVLGLRRKVGGATDVAELLPGNDVVILAADWPPYELGRWVNAACTAAGVPFVLAGQIPPVLKIGPTYVPGTSACFECHERGLRRAFPLYDALAAHRREHAAEATTLGPASGVIGGLLAIEVMHLLLGRGAATEGRALLVDMQTLETRWESIDRDPSCPACGGP
jgi:bacteriocin biosynthesis cyclodehydratase domain-containing protein